MTREGLPMKDLLAEIDARLRTLEPLVREFEQLQAARAVLVDDGNPSAARRPSSTKRTQRRAPRGANRKAILLAIRTTPGISVSEIATTTGIKKETVHSTVYALVRARLLKRRGSRLSLVDIRDSTTTRSPTRTADKPSRRRPKARSSRRRPKVRASHEAVSMNGGRDATQQQDVNTPEASSAVGSET